MRPSQVNRDTDRDGVRIRPDIILDLPERVYVLDVVVAWDANTGSLEHVNAGKRTKYASLTSVLGPKSPPPTTSREKDPLFPGHG